MYGHQEGAYAYESAPVLTERERERWPVHRATGQYQWGGDVAYGSADRQRESLSDGRNSASATAGNFMREPQEANERTSSRYWPDAAGHHATQSTVHRDACVGDNYFRRVVELEPPPVSEARSYDQRQTFSSYTRSFRPDEESGSLRSPYRTHQRASQSRASGNSTFWDGSSRERDFSRRVQIESMDLDTENSAEQAQGQQNNCAEHKDEPLKLFCSVCKVFICYECVASGHKDEEGKAHETVPLRDTLEEYKSYIGTMAAHLQEDLVPRLSSAIRHVGDVSRSLEHHAVAARRDIHEHVQHLAQTLEAYWIKKVDEVEQHRHKSLQDQRNQLQTQLSTICDVLEDCQRTLMPGSSSPAMVSLCQEVQQRLLDVQGMLVEEYACESDVMFWSPQLPFNTEVISGGYLHTETAYGPLCVAFGLGTRMAFKNEEMEISLQMCDRFGQKMVAGGDRIQAFWLETSAKRSPPPEVVVVDHKDGRVRLSFMFTTQKVGIYQLRVLVNGIDVAGSPFSVNRGSWGLVSAVNTGDVRIISNRQAVSRSANQYVIGNKGFREGEHRWKAEFQGGRLSIGVVCAVDPRGPETVEAIQRRSWGWCDGMTYEGPSKEPVPSTTNLDYAQVVYLALDCRAHTLTMSTQPFEEEKQGKQVKLTGLPDDDLFPLFAVRHGGNKVLVEPL